MFSHGMIEAYVAAQAALGNEGASPQLLLLLVLILLLVLDLDVDVVTFPQ